MHVLNTKDKFRSILELYLVTFDPSVATLSMHSGTDYMKPLMRDEAIRIKGLTILFKTRFAKWDKM